MKKSFILFLFISLFTWLNAQETQMPKPDTRLIDALGQETVDQYLSTNPQLVDYYNFFLANSYSIIEMPKEKRGDYMELEELKLKDKFASETPDYSQAGINKFNVMKYDFNIDQLYGGIYRLGNSGKIISFRSGKEIMIMYNESKTK